MHRDIDGGHSCMVQENKRSTIRVGLYYTFALLCNNAAEIAFPIPLAPPVTMATEPFKFIFVRIQTTKFRRTNKLV